LTLLLEIGVSTYRRGARSETGSRAKNQLLITDARPKALGASSRPVNVAPLQNDPISPTRS
jgi:hypothetical protein